MPNTFLGIETTRRALQTHQRSLETTGHNIANANTEGYSRQQAVLSASQPYTVPTLHSNLTAGQLGTGVEVNQIRRIRNDYLDVQVRDSASSLHYWQAQEDIFARIESVFPEPGATGIGDTLTKFFSTWHDLNNNPQDPGVKATVAEVGDELATLMRETYTQLSNISESVAEIKDDGTGNLVLSGGQMRDQVNAVNDILKQIRDVTEAIKKVYAHGNQPNDLLDKRDLLLDQLAQYGPVSATHLTNGGKPTGEINFTFYGVDVRAAGITVDLEYVSGTDDEVNLTIKDSTNTTLASISLADSLSGSLAGLEEIRTKIAGYQEQLDNLAGALRYTLNQILNPEFFTGELKKGDFMVTSNVMNNPATNIDGTKAIYVARLYNISMDGSIVDLGDDVKVTTSDLSGATYSEYFNGLLADIGARSGSASDMSENQQAINEQILSLRESASGVNLDEELSLLIQFQHGYQASARVMTTLDELLDHLINRTG